jgi:NTE family protein
MDNFINNREDFTLVLSGGGALGIAHLGVLEDLEDLDIKPKEIIGTSMGGIIGACMSIGMKEKDIYILFEKFNNVLNWVSFSFSGNSIITKNKIEIIFKEVFGNKTMSDTVIDLKLISTELYTGELKVFTKEDNVTIVEALLATMAIPGVFEEQVIGDIVYVDGFLSENLAINQAIHNNILAIDVLGAKSFVGSVIKNKNVFKTQNVLNMIERSMRILIYNQTKNSLNNIQDKNIILIDIDTKEFKTFQFHKLKEIKELGKNLLKEDIK